MTAWLIDGGGSSTDLVARWVNTWLAGFRPCSTKHLLALHHISLLGEQALLREKSIDGVKNEGLSSCHASEIVDHKEGHEEGDIRLDFRP